MEEEEFFKDGFSMQEANFLNEFHLNLANENDFLRISLLDKFLEKKLPKIKGGN